MGVSINGTGHGLIGRHKAGRYPAVLRSSARSLGTTPNRLLRHYRRQRGQ